MGRRLGKLLRIARDEYACRGDGLIQSDCAWERSEYFATVHLDSQFHVGPVDPADFGDFSNIWDGDLCGIYDPGKSAER